MFIDAEIHVFVALPLNSEIVLSLTLNQVLKGPLGLLLTPPWAGIPRSQILPGSVSRFNRDVLLSYCHQVKFCSDRYLSTLGTQLH